MYFGDAISVSDYYEAYKENQPRGMNQLRERVEEELKKYIIHIENVEYYDMIDFLRYFFLPEMNCKKGKQPDQFYAQQKIITYLNKFIEEKPQEAKNLNENVIAFESLLDKLNLRLWVTHKPNYSFFKLVLQALILLGTFPLFLYGALLNIIPFRLPVKLTKKVKDPQFLSSFRMVISLLLFPVFYLILAIIAGFVWGHGLINLAFVISLPLTGLFAFHYFIQAKKLWAKIRYTYLGWKKNPDVEKLKSLYCEIRNSWKQIF